MKFKKKLFFFKKKNSCQYISLKTTNVNFTKKVAKSYGFLLWGLQCLFKHYNKFSGNLLRSCRDRPGSMRHIASGMAINT